MTRFILPIILLGITIAVFFTFTDPIYKEIKELRAQAASYDEALANSKALEAERDKLTQKYNSIGGENIERLNKLLPENVDNIRLILEIEKIAAPYGMILKDVKYSSATEAIDTTDPNVVQGGASIGPADYGIWQLEFKTSGSYVNFQSFLRDLEKNLRIVDVASIEFSSVVSEKNPDVYDYNFKIKTYWLKN